MSTTAPETMEIRSPLDDSIVGTFPIMDAAAVDEVVDRARIAATWWEEQAFEERKKRLLKFAAILASRSGELAELVHSEGGKPVDDANLEIILSIEHTVWAAKQYQRVLGRRRVLPGMLTLNHDARKEYEPLGVVGVIGPWNYPVFTPVGSISYALAAGNSVVFKPSEYTTATGAWLIDVLGEVFPELPVAQLITGYGPTGAALVDAGVNKISFTGSTATGKKVMAAAAKHLTPVTLELGGKDAVIVDRSADLDKAADAVTFGAFSNGGQTCVGVERVYVLEDVYDEFLGLVAEKTRALSPGKIRGASYGPMTMPSQVDVVRTHVLDAIQRGAEPVVGGEHSVGDDRVIEPVVLANAPEDSLAVLEETFGPTVVVNKVRSVNEAVERANASKYGLAASVFGEDRDVIEQAARDLRVGMVAMNSWVMFAGVSALPWGGVGESGIGRIHGDDGLREFARAKSTVRERFSLPIPLVSFERHPEASSTVLKLMTMLYGRHK